MKNVRLLIEYDGTNYSGWQKQDDVPSIQEEIEKAIQKVTGEEVNLVASGRTDKGVHALGQVANFYTESNIPGDRFRASLNTKLPLDIQIRESEEVDMDFHSRFSASKKRYRYLIYNNRIARPVYRNLSFHVRKPMDIDKLKEASQVFVGTHDFESFMARKSVVDTTERTIYSIDVVENGEFIEVIIVGKSFLRHMIRIMIGTLVDVSLGKKDIEDINSILEGKNRSLAGVTAPAQGLFLEKVYYCQ